MDHSSPGSSVHGILQARILEWVAMPFSKESSQPRDWTLFSASPALAGGLLPLAPLGKMVDLQFCVNFYCTAEWFSYTFFFILFIYLIGGKLLYNVVLVSAIQQCKLAITIYIYISPPFWTSLPFPPTRLLSWAPGQALLHVAACLPALPPALTLTWLCSRGGQFGGPHHMKGKGVPWVLGRFSHVQFFLCDPTDCMQPARLFCPWDSPSKNTRMDCHALLQGWNPSVLSPALAGGFFSTNATWEDQLIAKVVV